MRSGFTGVSLVVLVALMSMANSPITKNEVVPDPGEGTAADTCNAYWYLVYTFTDGRGIPDNVVNGLISGPLWVDDWRRVLDTAIDVKISHTWVGDLIIKLHYDPECDGYADDEDAAVALLCRPDLEGCPVDSCCGCPDDLALAYDYRWSSRGVEYVGEPWGPFGVVLPGCYHEAVESANLLSDIEWMKGCWWLVVSDCAGADTGVLASWTLRFAPQGSGAAEAATWGTVKTTFRE